MILTCPDGYELRLTRDDAIELSKMIVEAVKGGATYIQFNNVKIWLAQGARNGVN
jgi:hypothetical protein